jgi:hypothetical protein
MTALAPNAPLYRPATSPHDGVNDREALARAERYAVVAEEKFSAAENADSYGAGRAALYEQAAVAAQLAQTFATIALAARTGLSS